jgi:hypothetical protein
MKYFATLEEIRDFKRDSKIQVDFKTPLNSKVRESKVFIAKSAKMTIILRPYTII